MFSHVAAAVGAQQLSPLPYNSVTFKAILTQKIHYSSFRLSINNEKKSSIIFEHIKTAKTGEKNQFIDKLRPIQQVGGLKLAKPTLSSS